MIIFLWTLHVLSAALMIVLILLQPGKGAEGGSVLGSGSSAIFGVRGTANLLTRSTAVCAMVFFLSSLILAKLHAEKPKSLLEGSQPAQQQEPPKKPDPAQDIPR
jgi:preprotein translocase subunit SecG